MGLLKEGGEKKNRAIQVEGDSRQTDARHEAVSTSSPSTQADIWDEHVDG